ncbi:MAG: arginine--tRNA ligase [Candidatus Yonathbacteria bacterium]|nr:arginine--tRNA ligase [Candidatus Yonathbacteria bacterium]
MKEKMERVVAEALEALGVEVGAVSIERPGNLSHGDYSTNAALVYGKKTGVPARRGLSFKRSSQAMAGWSPRELAGQIVEKILEIPSEDIKKIEVAGAGFINFFIEDEAIRSENSKEKSSLATKYGGMKIIVEHSSPNLFKPFHIGHLMNNIIGEFVTRATAIGGGTVTTISFPSDVSLGIAKAVYILIEDKKEGRDVFTLSDEEKIIAFGEAYRRGVAHFDEHPEEISKAKEIAKIVFDKNHLSEARSIFDKAKEINTAYFIKTIQELGSTINETIFESEAGVRGHEIVEGNTGDGKVFTKSEGAIVYTPDESRNNLHTQVFINSEGHPTYEAKDLGLIDLKFSKFSPDLSYFITDAEQASHFRVVLDAAGKLGGEWPMRVEKSLHVPHGRMLFKGQKMSSRLGGVPLALDVIAVVEEEVRERAGERTTHLSADEKKKLEREIALSALRIAVLRSKPGININFDPETSLSFEGDSGPYLLYTHARCASLLEKGREKGYESKFKDTPATDLERALLQYELELSGAIADLAPQKLVTYLFEIAQLFNGFYAEHQILTDDRETSEHYLAIVRRLKAVLKEGLWVLGISAPNKM